MWQSTQVHNKNCDTQPRTIKSVVFWGKNFPQKLSLKNKLKSLSVSKTNNRIWILSKSDSEFRPHLGCCKRHASISHRHRVAARKWQSDRRCLQRADIWSRWETKLRFKRFHEMPHFDTAKPDGPAPMMQMSRISPTCASGRSDMFVARVQYEPWNIANCAYRTSIDGGEPKVISWRI